MNTLTQLKCSSGTSSLSDRARATHANPTSLALLVILGFLVAASNSFQLCAQTLEFDIKLTTVPNGTNDTTVSVSFAGESVSAAGKGTTNGCGPTVESESKSVTVEFGKSYVLTLDVIGCTCAGTEVSFSFVPDDCAGMSIINLDGLFEVDRVYEDDGVCSGEGGPFRLQWQITFRTNTASIAFPKLCPDGLFANGVSVAEAVLNNASLKTPISWSIESPTLGCVIIDQSDSGCLVGSGFEEGTIYLRATGTNGCYTRAPLDLLDPGDEVSGDGGDNGGGCRSGRCGSDGRSGFDGGQSSTAFGESGTGSGLEFGDGKVDLGSIDVSLFLGVGKDGRSSGMLKLVTNLPSGNMYTPRALTYPWMRGDVAVVTNQDGSMRQVKTPQGLVDIVVSNASYYSINCYRLGQFGDVTTNGFPLIGIPAPFVVWTVQNPDAATTNRLRVTQAPLNQASVAHEYRWLTNGWELDSASGLRVKTKIFNYVTNGAVYMTEIDTTRLGAGSAVSQHTKTWYVDSPGDFMLLEETWGTGTNARTNIYSDSWIVPGKVVRWDGSWDWNIYDSKYRLTTNFSSYFNQTLTNNPSLCRMTVYDYSTNTVTGSGDAGTVGAYSARSETDYITNQPVAKRYHVYLPGEHQEIRCISPTAAWNDSGNLKTTTTTYTNGLFYGRLRSVKRPDGTMELYSYAAADYTGGAYTDRQNVTNIVMSGQPDSYATNIVSGTKTTTVIEPLGQTLSRVTIDLPSQIVIASESYSEFDDYNRPRKVSHLDGTWTYTEYACCGAQTVTNREGIVTTYTRDVLKRVVAATTTTDAGSITRSNHYDAAGRVLVVTRTGGGSTMTNSSQAFDLAGRTISSTDALGNTSRLFESLPPLVLSTTNADLGTRIETRFRDGRTASVTGTAAFPARYEYGSEAEGGYQRAYMKEIKLDLGGSDTSEWVKNFTDGAGHNYKTLYAGSGAPCQQSYFNNAGQLWKQIDPDGVVTLFGYNAKGERAYTVIDSNRNDTIDFAGQDRITQTTNDVLVAHGTNVLRTRTYTWLSDASSSSTLISTVERSVEGSKSWSDTDGAVISSVKTLPSNGTYTDTQNAPDGSYSVTLFQSGRTASVTLYDSGSAQVGKTSYGYDSHGRRTTVTDARNGTTYYTFNNADRVTGVTTPVPGTLGGVAQTTTSVLDSMGRATNVVQPDGTGVSSMFSLRGELLRASGSRAYPVGYGYDPQGRMKYMTNWSGFSAAAGVRVTTWHYDASRGWLTNKVYDDGKGTKYTYTAAGRLSSRLWARGTNTTYAYNNCGDLQSVTYNDGSTPTNTYTYTRRGQSDKVTHGSDTWRLFYTTAGQLLSEAGTAGTLNGLRVTNRFDQWLRRTNMSTANGATILVTNGYGYDSAGRMSTARDGTFVATYSYLANSPLVSQIEFKSNTTVRLTTTKQYDNLSRLTSVSSVAGGARPAVFSYSYDYNDANQRTRVNLADGSFWIYSYDSLGQVVSGKRYWSDWTPVAGQQYEYGFDDIGNRTSSKTGGDANGAGLRAASYTNNAINQLTGRDIPTYLNVIGVASATATNVNVNNTFASRQGEYYWAELSVNNSSPLWQSVTNRAVQSGTTNSVTGNVFVPKHAESLSYDADGNLTNDGRWVYVWDGENRLARMVAPSTIPTGARKTLLFGYDWQGRRITKTVSNWTGSAWSRVLDEKFLYDGWNLVSSLNASNTALAQSLLWGNDLSGSQQGAGGVGGLLAVTTKGAHVTFPAFDGNGNVMALINASSTNVLATYEYGPFGEVVRASGTAAKANPCRFSTKYQDEDSDLLYYGYRFYNASTGRWLSRDPIGEIAFRSHLQRNRAQTAQEIESRAEPRREAQFRNIFVPKAKAADSSYAAFENSPLNFIDPLGLWVMCCRDVNAQPGDNIKIKVAASLGWHCELQGGDKCTGGDSPWISYETTIDRSPGRKMKNGQCCSAVTENDVRECIMKNFQHQGELLNNCHSAARNQIGRCCLKTKWSPSWYGGDDRGECLESHFLYLPDGNVVWICDKWEFPNGFNKGLPGTCN